MAGDTVLVHEGEYREWVRPRRGGLSATRRITYQAAPGEHVVIKGSERVTGWEPGQGTVWRASVPNALFGDWNPFAQEVAGDWLAEPEPPLRRHLGDVYLNGLSFYEAASRDEVTDPPLRTEVTDHWTRMTGRVRNPGQTRLAWYAEVGEDTTVIWANFQGADPNAELAEVNVRRSVFSPVEHHVDYITVRGFELAQAACPWAPPTAGQPGLIGPNWAKGWIIEDNVIHDAKCSAVSLGKEASTGDNYATLRGDKPGYQYQLESVFAARQIGWDREHAGSHVVRRNTIFDCGQNAIVGNLGCVFSTIEDNHIYNIAVKREFYGYEDRRHQAARRDRRRDPAQPHPRLLARHLARLAGPGHPRLAQPLLPQQPGPVRRGQPRPVPHRPQRPRLAGLARVVQPGRRLRAQPHRRHGAAGARHGPGDALPPAAQHAGGRLRRDLRRRRPLDRQRLPRRRHRNGVRARHHEGHPSPGTLRHRWLRRLPDVARGVHRPHQHPAPRRRPLRRRQAARLHS